MAIRVDTKLATPIFKQIVEEIERMVIIGEMVCGDFVPSVRELSTRFDINPNTISKAYQQLQFHGLIEAVRGKGLRITKQNKQSLEKRLDKIFENKTRQLVSDAKAFEFQFDDVILKLTAEHRRGQE